jgi:transglutaminase-like putative cysteine protease
MLRTIGIPTRLVTGYGPGERNPLTGYFEVKQSDAHAWVEVYYPGIGWVPYDPTFGVPEAAPHPSSRFIGGEVLAAVGRFLSTAVPQPVKDLFRNAARGIGVVWGGLHGVQALAAFGVIGLLLWYLVVRRRRGSRLPAQALALGAYLDLTRALASLGHPLMEHATPREYLRRVTADPAIERAVVAEAEVVVATLERDRFSGRPAADADLDRSRAAVKRVRDLVARG